MAVFSLCVKNFKSNKLSECQLSNNDIFKVKLVPVKCLRLSLEMEVQFKQNKYPINASYPCFKDTTFSREVILHSVAANSKASYEIVTGSRSRIETTKSNHIG